MIPCAVPTEVIENVSFHLGVLDFKSLYRLWQLLDLHQPQVLRDLLQANMRDITNAIVQTRDLLFIKTAISNGARIDRAQQLQLLNPYSGDILDYIRRRPTQCRGSPLGWKDVLQNVANEDDVLHFISWWKTVQPIKKAEVTELIDRKFNRVIRFILEHNLNAPWLHFRTLTHPDAFPALGDSWSTFQKLFLDTKSLNGKRLKGYRLENAEQSDFLEALKAVLSRVETHETLVAYEMEISESTSPWKGYVTGPFRQAKIRLQLPLSAFGTNNRLTEEFIEELSEDRLLQAIAEDVFADIRVNAMRALADKEYWTVIKALLVKNVAGAWDATLQAPMVLPWISSAMLQILRDTSVQGPNRPLSAQQTTMMMRAGQTFYLAAHPEWGQNMSLTYIAVGLGEISFVDLMLRRMGRAKKFPHSPPFDLQGAMFLAWERDQNEMLSYLKNI